MNTIQRRLALVAAAAVVVAVPFAGTAGATNGATSGTPTFATTALAGSSGSSEPRVTVAPRGIRYLDTNATDGTEVVYRSTDGRTWTRTRSVPPGQTAPTTDVDIVSTRTGRVIASELDFAGINFRTAYSDDGGRTWTDSAGTTYADTDRQWLAVGPDDPQTHQPRVYLLFHNLLSGEAGHNMFVATSTDGGATFGTPVPVTNPANSQTRQTYLDLQCADSGGPSNIVVNKRTGRVYVVFGTRSSVIGGCAATPAEVNVVAADRVWVVTAPAAGTTDTMAWRASLAVNDSPTHQIVGMQLAPGAVDRAGNVYVVYPESINPYPDYSGAAIKVVHAPANLSSWSKPTVVAPAGGAGNILPHIVAGEAGKVDVAYFTGVAGGRTPEWHSVAAQSLDALGPTPHWTHTRLSDVITERGTASELMGACNQGPTATLNGFACGRAADVYGIDLDRCGRLLVTWPAQGGVKEGTYVAQQTGGPTVTGCG